MHDELSLKQIQKEWHGTLKSYLIGFTSSLLLTAASFATVLSGLLAGQQLIYALVALALTQAVIQLIFFLHVGQEAKPRWETLVFYFMLLILMIVAGGSLWIMFDLNDRMMPAKEMTHD